MIGVRVEGLPGIALWVSSDDTFLMRPINDAARGFTDLGDVLIDRLCWKVTDADSARDCVSG